jgi:hypothetical protein
MAIVYNALDTWLRLVPLRRKARIENRHNDVSVVQGLMNDAKPALRQASRNFSARRALADYARSLRAP